MKFSISELKQSHGFRLISGNRIYFSVLRLIWVMSSICSLDDLLCPSIKLLKFLDIVCIELCVRKHNVMEYCVGKKFFDSSVYSCFNFCLYIVCERLIVKKIPPCIIFLLPVLWSRCGRWKWIFKFYSLDGACDKKIKRNK